MLAEAHTHACALRLRRYTTPPAPPALPAHSHISLPLLPWLQVLRLDKNKLYGSLAAAWVTPTAFPSLTNLNVASNCVCGDQGV